MRRKRSSARARAHSGAIEPQTILAWSKKAIANAKSTSDSISARPRIIGVWMRGAAPGLRLMPSRAAAATAPLTGRPTSTARPIAIPAPIAAAACAPPPTPPPASCAKALEEIRVDIATVARATFFLDIIIDSLVFPAARNVVLAESVSRSGPALVRLVFGRQPNVDASEQREDQGLNQDDQNTEEHDRHRHQHRHQAQEDPENQVV